VAREPVKADHAVRLLAESPPQPADDQSPTRLRQCSRPPPRWSDRTQPARNHQSIQLCCTP